MSKVIVEVNNLSKQYRLGQFGTGSLSHDLNRFWHKVRGKEDPYLKVTETNVRDSKEQSSYVWALKDVSFQLREGEVMGVVGTNGAGKSTLLKLLSRITSPTTGSIKMKGRISSLLEVGTGFHPELTGRENIYLNGAILGMTRKEISQKLDEIVDFSGCENYVDTPVKRYSSGMVVRLGFAVAAHLESEILVVDEVLAVGDQAFQKKCVGKMKDISRGGRAVLFVSHNLSSVSNLCESGILLESGELKFKGNIKETVGHYLSNKSFENQLTYDLTRYEEREGTGDMQFAELSFLKNGELSKSVCIGDDLGLRIKIRSKKEINFRMAIHLYKYDETLLSNIENGDSNFELEAFRGERVFEVTFKDFNLYPSTYKIGLWIGDAISGQHIDMLRFCGQFEVEDGSTKVNRPLPLSSGVIYYQPEWEIK
ncbi:MAG: ATP-binding cassette domain-containing protein [Crocinitomicaceae bacterium]|nr:ATP-binding cassette domain-containing protein [Crocinitomicaceae bacterium]